MNGISLVLTAEPLNNHKTNQVCAKALARAPVLRATASTPEGTQEGCGSQLQADPTVSPITVQSRKGHKQSLHSAMEGEVMQQKCADKKL